MRAVKAIVAFVALSAASVACHAEEWPKWLGPNANGISTEPIASQWPAEGPKKLWEQKVGVGYSSPIALDGKVYLFYQVGDEERLSAFDAQSGRPVWTQSYKDTVRADPSGPQDTNPDSGYPLPLATPTIDNGKIYSYGGGGDLVCRKLEDGSEIWHTNVLRELGERILQWAEASSPLVTDKVVYVQGGRGGPTAVAIDKETGKIVMKSQSTSMGGYAAPIIADVQGTKQLVVFGNEQVIGMNPESGKTIWSFPWSNRAHVNAATPNYRDGYLFISSDYQTGCMILKLTPDGATKAWQNKVIQEKFQPGILDGDYLYTNSGGTIKCMHWPDGKIAWEANDPKLRLNEGGSLVRDGDKLIAMSERGKLSLVQAMPKSWKLISQVQMFDFLKTWSTPLIYRGKLYCMGEDTLVCLDISSNTARGNDWGGTGVSPVQTALGR